MRFRILSCSILLLVGSAIHAIGADIDCTRANISNCGFGAMIGQPMTTNLAVFVGSGFVFTGSETEMTFQSNTAVYTYVYQFTLNTTTGEIGDLSIIGDVTIQAFDPSLDFGVLTNQAWTTPGVNDCTDATHAPTCIGGVGFDFSNLFGFNSAPGFLGPSLGPAQYTFYAQSKYGPGPGVFTAFFIPALGGVSSDSVNTIAPVPEPSSLVFFGCAVTAILLGKGRGESSPSAGAAVDQRRKPAGMLSSPSSYREPHNFVQFKSRLSGG